MHFSKMLSRSDMALLSHQLLMAEAPSENESTTCSPMNSNAIPSFRYSGMFSRSSSVLIKTPDISIPKPSEAMSLSKAIGRKLELFREEESLRSSKQLWIILFCLSVSEFIGLYDWLSFISVALCDYVDAIINIFCSTSKEIKFVLVE
ncbi:hypothetical protein EMIT0196P_150110 [Pseudomonas chlororaphis]